MRRKSKPKPPVRNGPGVIAPGMTGFAIAFAIAAKRAKEEVEKKQYAESHGGHKVPRRKKSAGNRDKRAGR